MKARLVCAMAAAVLLAAGAVSRAAAEEVVIHSVAGEYEDVKQRVTFAIENHGLVLDHVSRVGGMLERTGKALGRARQVYAKAEVLQFCSARLSRDAMEADPRSIVFCPYAIAIYALPQDPGKIYLAYRKPAAIGSAQSVKALRAVEALLDGIVREALR